MLYPVIILGSMLLIILTNVLILSCPSLALVGQIALSTILGTVSVIAWDGLVALLIRRLLPVRWFSPLCVWSNVGKQERHWYRSIGICAWKNRIPELGCFTSFRKSEFVSPGDTAYLARFLIESNYGVAIHLANAILGFLIAFLPWCSSPCIAVPIALVNMILSLLPVAVLRFNAAPLRNIYMRQISRESSVNVTP